MADIDIQKQQVIDAGNKLVAEGLVAITWGNVSMRIDSDYMLVTPSGRKYDELKVDDIVLVNVKTNKYEGNVKPSSEYKLHTEIYKTRPKIGAVIHTHQMNASTVAAARREVPPILDDQAQI